MAQKTFEEILSESTELKLTDKFKNKIFEFSNDVHAMGIVVNTREDGDSKFFFKDQEYTKPVTDNELLAMYLDEVVPTRLVDSNKSLEKIRDLKSEKLKFLEYKSDDITKKFYKIGNYFSGETYNSFHDGSEVEQRIIWSGTFTPTEETVEGHTYYNYQTREDLQHAELLADIPAVAVTFDGVTYNLAIGYEETGEHVYIGPYNDNFDSIPFNINYGSISPSDSTKEIVISCKDANQHTIEVKELGGRTIVPEYTYTVGQDEPGYYMYNSALFDRLPDTLDITVNGTLYEAVPTYDKDEGGISYGGNQSDWAQSEYPFAIYFNKNADLQVLTEQAGDYTIKIEGDLKDETPIIVPGGGEDTEG